MHTFRTELHIAENPDKIHYNSSILSLGSGFGNTIASHLGKYQFQVNNNPYGTIYNPLSIFKLLEISGKSKPLNTELVTEKHGVWNHFNFHLRSDATSKQEVNQYANQLVDETHSYFKKTDFLILTFGSAYVYRHKKTGEVVANCHKASSDLFTKELLDAKDIVKQFRQVYSSLNHIGNIILVVSPVMHTGDSITLNTVSKSVLRLACHLIMSEFPYVKYFPAYEFLLSDLRDYRFYQKDLINPTEQAMDYIFDKFVEAYMDDDSKTSIGAIEEVLSRLGRNPYNPQSEAYQLKIRDAIAEVERISKGKIDVSAVVEDLNAKLV